MTDAPWFQSNGHPTGCTCAKCPPRLPRLPDIQPGTEQHRLWLLDQEQKRYAAEARFAETSAHRPAHSGLGQHLAGKRNAGATRTE